MPYSHRELTLEFSRRLIVWAWRSIHGKNEDLGKFVRTKKGKRFWTCIDCQLVHIPEIANYLASHPEATTKELKSLKNKVIPRS